MEPLNMNNNYKPDNKVGATGSPSRQSKKLFSDPKINKVLIAVGIVFALVIVAAIIFVAVPSTTWAGIGA